MANYTATSNMTLEAAIAAGPMASGEDLTINNGAIVTCDRTPSILIGNVTINNGKLLIDGANAYLGDPILFIGEIAMQINVNSLGTLETTRGWYEVGTSDGSANQEFSLTDYWNDHFEDYLSGCWVETGRRIYYDNASGTTPIVDDWVYKTGSASTVYGRVTAVGTDGTYGTYVIVKYLTGTVADNADIEVRKVKENVGPDYQITWTAKVNYASGDIREAGVYQEFGNCWQVQTDNIGSCGPRITGFFFTHAFQENHMSFGNGTTGFIPPNGAKIRLPMITFASGTTTTFAAGNTSANTAFGSRYNLELSVGGDCIFRGANIGSACFTDAQGGNWLAEDCAANLEFGTNVCPNQVIFTRVIVGFDFYTSQYSSRYAFMLSGLSNGAVLTDCFHSQFISYSMYGMGAGTCSNVTFKNCISIALYGGSQNRVSLCTNVVYDNCYVCGAMGFLTTNGITIKNHKHSMKFDETFASGNYVAISIQDLCSDVLVQGLEHFGCPGYYIFYILNSNDIKIRAIGLITEKITFAGSYVLYLSGLIQNFSIARCWYDGDIAQFYYGGKGFEFINCSAGYDQEIDCAGSNIIFKGLHSGSGNYGTGASGIICTYTGRGYHFNDIFRSDTTGVIYLIFGTESVETTGIINITAGNPVFWKTGQLDMVAGDVVEFTMPYFALGHDTLVGFDSVVGTTGSYGTDEFSTNITVDFQYDLGSGWNGSWLSARTAANITGITGTVDGIRFKFRLTCATTLADLRLLGIRTTTSLAYQTANFHPIDQNYVNVKVTVRDVATQAVIEGAMVLLEAGTGGDLAEGTDILKNATNSLGVLSTASFLYTANQPVVGRVRKGTSSVLYKSASFVGTITAAGLDTTVLMVRDE